MKFHNQRSFMEHEISNVNNKPLLRKKGKQWIVVAVLALILAGFGGMVSTTTHADTTNAQPTTTKVAPKSSNSNVMKQAQGIHKALANNAAVQKPSVLNSAVAKKTAPASVASTSSAKSSVASNSNSSNNKATKPAVHMLGMGAPVLMNNPSTNDMIIPPFGTVVASGNMPQSTGNTAKWSLDQNGVFLIHDGIFSAKNSGTWGNADIPNNEVNNIQYIEFHNVDIPNDFSINNMPNLKIIDFSGINPSTPDTESPHYWQGALMNNPKLVTINFGQNLHTQNISGDTGSFMSGDSSLKNLRYFNKLDLSGLTDTNDFFKGDSSLTNLDLSNFNSTNARNNNKAAWGGTNGLTDFITGCTALRTITLGSNTILTSKAINDNINGSFAFGPTGLANIADGQSHPGNWVLLQGANSTTANGVQWTQDQNHDLIIHNGTMTSNAWPTNINKSNIQHIYTSNLTAPTSLNSTFASLSNLQSIDLSGMTITNSTTDMGSLFQNDRNLQSIKFASDNSNNSTSDVTNMSWMFAGDYSLKNLRLPKWFNTIKTNISFMFDSDNNNVENIPGSTYPGLQSLTLPDGFKNTKGSTNVFGAGPTSQTYNLYNLTLGSDTRLGNANLPNNQWTQDSKTLSSSDLESNSNHAGTWNGPVTETIIYQYNGKNVPFQSNYESNPGYYKPRGTNGTVNSGMNWDAYSINHMPTNWNVVPNDPSLNFKYSDGIHYVNIAPNTATDTIIYETSPNNVILTKTVSGPNNTVNYPQGFSDDCKFNANTSIPSGYYAKSDIKIPYSYDGKNGDNPQIVTIMPYTDYLDYYMNNTNSGSNIIGSTSNNIVNNTNLKKGNNNFTIPLNYNVDLPAGYHIVSGDGISNPANNNDGLTFNYQNGSHKVLIAPNTITVNYKNGNQTISSSAVSYASGRSTYDDFAMPANYSLASGQSNNPLSFNKNGYSVNVRVTPKQVTDTIDYIANYPNGSTLVSSASSTGNDYQAQGAINTQFTVTSAPANYQLIPNKNNTFNYDNSTHDVAVEPAQNSQKTDVINYMNGDAKIASDVYTGNDMYAPNANHTSYNANDYVPAGYHVVNDGGNTFYFDGQTHDVTVYPNSITLEFNNGQAGSKKVDDLKGTTYQIKSSDVPANYQLTNPSDNVVDLSNLGKSTDYNVDVSPIQQPVTPSTPSVPSTNVQPSVPYVPSMPSDTTPASSVASASSASSAVAMPSSVALQTSVAPSASTSVSHYSHYRYTKVITPSQLHTSKHFTKKNGVLTIKHPTSFKIMKIVHDHKLTRYEVKYQGHSYFITANNHFAINDYVQKHDFKSHKHMMVKVITPMIEYKHAHFNKKNAIRVFKKGAILPVKKVFTIGKGEMTRFELTNGRFVTSNKLFVKVIK